MVICRQPVGGRHRRVSGDMTVASATTTGGTSVGDAACVAGGGSAGASNVAGVADDGGEANGAGDGNEVGSGSGVAVATMTTTRYKGAGVPGCAASTVFSAGRVAVIAATGEGALATAVAFCRRSHTVPPSPRPTTTTMPAPVRPALQRSLAGPGEHSPPLPP